MKLSDRVDKIEAALVSHLEESGTIRTDLAWLKKAFWILTTAIVTELIAHISIIGGHHDKQSLPQVPEVRRSNQD